MYFLTLSKNDLGKRLDPGHYCPELLKMKTHVEKHFNSISFSNACQRMNSGPFGSALHASSYVSSDNGVIFIRPQDCKDLLVNTDNQNVYISHSDHRRLKSSQFAAGSIIITKIGNGIGDMAIVPTNITTCNISGNAMGAILKDYDPYCAIAYLRSDYGQAEIKRGLSGGPKPKIDMGSIGDIIFPLFQNKAQKYIGDKVRQAERLRISTKQTKEMIRSSMKYFFAGISKPTKNISVKISKNNLSSNRLEAEYYSSISLWAENEVKHGPFPYKPLKDIVLRIKDGPGGWGVSTEDYTENGIPVIRTVNIIDGECTLSNCIFISEKKHRELATHTAKKGSVVLSVRGTIGRAAVFDDDVYQEANLNAAVVTIDCSDQIIPGYLVEFFNSEVGSIQSNRIANGAVQKNMNLVETGSNLITVPPLSEQIKIAELHALYINQKRYSSMLIQSAKLLVEGLIKGQITEQQLIEAQTALEVGDNSLDKCILSKITNKGIDVKGKPLFGNFDKLYDLIQESHESIERKENE